MTTIHLTDAQRDTFEACGLIVIDGDSEAWALRPDRRVVTLTATCPEKWCRDGKVSYPEWEGDVRQCECCDWSGRVTLGRFTIPALQQVIHPEHWNMLDPLPRPGQFIARPERAE